MLLLAFDTATPAVTVAVHDGSRVLASSTTVDAHRQAELLTPAIAAVLTQAGTTKEAITAVVAGVGPGPYTGLRVGVVTARVLASTLGVPGYGVCTLDAIAAAAGRDDDYLVATDARRREVYWARYSGRRRESGPDVGKPADVPAGDLPVAGTGAALYPDAFPNRISPEYPDAGVLAALVVEQLSAVETAGIVGGLAGAVGAASATELLPLEPLYLRRPDAREPGARKSVLRL
ncbi:MAG: tRNA (adenosine(37)-N6)-threonylcarbamoyltransferase complex dimerization subunit type 1 TsaB [Streptosporangiaceae bacterium]